jgi:hypothetical protein
MFPVLQQMGHKQAAATTTSAPPLSPFPHFNSATFPMVCTQTAATATGTTAASSLENPFTTQETATRSPYFQPDVINGQSSTGVSTSNLTQVGSLKSDPCGIPIEIRIMALTRALAQLKAEISQNGDPMNLRPTLATFDLSSFISSLSTFETPLTEPLMRTPGSSLTLPLIRAESSTIQEPPARLEVPRAVRDYHPA